MRCEMSRSTWENEGSETCLLSSLVLVVCNLLVVVVAVPPVESDHNAQLRNVATSTRRNVLSDLTASLSLLPPPPSPNPTTAS